MTTPETNGIYTLNVKISSKRWYDIFGELEISMPIAYNPYKDSDEKIIELAKNGYLNKTKNTVMYDIIHNCFSNEKYTICGGSKPSLHDIKKNNSIIYMCYHPCLCCNDNICLNIANMNINETNETNVTNVTNKTNEKNETNNLNIMD